MRIEKGQFIAGLPAREIRRFVRAAGEAIIRPGTVAEVLGISIRRAEQLLHDLEREDFLAATADAWKATEKGHALAMATAARPLRKETADRLVTEVIDRAQMINCDRGFAFRVQKLVLFGSVLRGVERPNDVDIGCQLVPRYQGERQKAAEDRRRASKSRFADTTEWAAWPKLEVIRRLKSGSRGLSLQEVGDWAIGTVDHRVIFTESEPKNQGVSDLNKRGGSETQRPKCPGIGP